MKMAPKVALPGTVVARNDSHLASEVEGRIAWVAEVGTVVKAGDVVARIDSNVAGMQLASDKANVARLSAQLSFDRSQAERMDRLSRKAPSPKPRATRRPPLATWITRRLARRRPRCTRASISSITAIFARRSLAASSPRLINAGEYATPARRSFGLCRHDSIEVKAQAPIDTAHFLQRRHAADGGDRQAPAFLRVSVQSCRLATNRAARSKLRIALKPGDAFVGDAAKVFVPSAAPRDVLAVPRDALVLREDNTYVFKVDGKNRATRVAVETGTEDGSMVEVRGPIKAGERVIVRGAERLEAGQKVQPVFAS